MADVPAIVAGIQTRLATITDLRASDTWPEKVNPPQAWLRPDGSRPLSMNRSLMAYRFELWLAVNPASFRTAQDSINEYISSEGARSVEAALFADDTLDGSASGILQFDLDRYQLVEIDAVKLMVAVWNLEVMA